MERLSDQISGMDDMPIAQKPRLVDMPIYLQFFFRDMSRLRYRWYVIDDDNKVRELHLPDTEYHIDRSGLAVANSRLFLVGGYCRTKDLKRKYEDNLNGIIYIDNIEEEKQKLEWKKITDWSPNLIHSVGGAVVSQDEDGDWICAVGQDRFQRCGLLRFHCHDFKIGSFIGDPPDAPKFDFPILLALSHHTKKLFVYFRPLMEECKSNWGKLCYYDFNDESWHDISFIPDPAAVAAPLQHTRPLSWYCLPESIAAVAVKNDSYLVTISVWHPVTREYAPALYVYDIVGRQWLPQTVLGLPYDGTVFPEPASEDTPDMSLSYASLLQVRRDELKLALLWSITVPWNIHTRTHAESEVHCTKFILSIQENEDPGIAPTFRARQLSSFFFTQHDFTTLIDSAAG